MILSILVSLFSSLAVPTDTSIHSTLEAQAIVSDAGVTPFWMRSLQYGSVPKENPGLVLRAWNGKSYNLKKKYDWKYEVEATGWTGKQNDFWLTQAYVSGRRGKWELWAGRRKEVYGLGDTTMTSGFYAWSGNAVPMPKIQLGTRDYLNFAKGWLGVHMTYSHGWFGDQGAIKNAFLHQKSLYGRIGKINSKISFIAGLNHQAIWGGQYKNKNNIVEIYPSGLNTYFYVITLLKNRTIIKIDTNTSWNDANNQYGNHLGSFDIQLNINLNDLKFQLYKQTPYETGRVFSLTTAGDGLYGFSINSTKTKIIKIINFEYFDTSNQGLYQSEISTLLGIKDSHFPETENYFNNGSDVGYVYQNSSIGTPLIIKDLDSKYRGINVFTYNAIRAFSISSGGTIFKNIKWNSKFLFSRNGTIINGENYPKTRSVKYINRQSFILNLSKNFNKNITAFITFAADSDDFLTKSNAILTGIKIYIK